MKTIKSQTEYSFKFKTLSPLLIASEELCISNVGGEDKSSIADPLTRVPLIPASSIKGKLRYMAYLLGFSEDERNRWFGCENAAKGPSVINIISVKLIDKPKIIEDKDLFFTKSETSIERLSNNANPRLYKAAVPQITFECRILINIYEDEESAEDIIQTVIEPCLFMLEDNYLGSGGSRGNGRICICDMGIVGSYEITKNTNKLSTGELEHHIVYMDIPYISDIKISSTTLAGAFACAMAVIGYDKSNIQHLLNGGEDGKSFRITSAFPYVKTNTANQTEWLRFFPIPYYCVDGIKTHENKKEYFKVKYISGTLFDEFSKDPHFLYKICEGIEKEYQLLNGLCMKHDEYELIRNNKLYEERDLTHVVINPETGHYKVDNDTNKGLLYQTKDYFFSNKYGFYFFIKHTFTDEVFSELLRVLEIMGIGADKSTGKGYVSFTQCHLDEKDKKWHHAEKTENSQYCSLSLIHPSQEDRNKLSNSTKSYYKVITRKGKRENNTMECKDKQRIEKHKLFFLSEGSVFDFSINGSSPSAYPEKNSEYKIKDFGYSYLIADR